MNSTIKEVNPKALQDKMKTMGFATIGKDHLDQTLPADLTIKEKMTYAQIAKIKPKVCLTLVTAPAADTTKVNDSKISLHVPLLSLNKNKSSKSIKTITNVKEKMSSALSNMYHMQEAEHYHQKA